MKSPSYDTIYIILLCPFFDVSVLEPWLVCTNELGTLDAVRAGS